MAGPASAGLSTAGLLIFGTLSSLFSKIIYGLRGEDKQGNGKYFRKPWASTAVMFVGMSFCLPIQALTDLSQRKQQQRRQQEDGTEPLLDSISNHDKENENTHVRFKDVILIGIPTAFDLIATVLMSIGLLSVTASVYQMLRGAEMLFAALFSVTILKRPLNKKHYTGLLLCFLGIVLVGASSLISGNGEGVDKNAGQIVLGMALIVLAQAVQAAQVTVEDHVLRDVGVAPLMVVGWEGVWGVLYFCILLPIVYFLPGEEGNGLHEDSLDTWHMLMHSLPSWAIPTVLIANGLSLLLYNVTGMFVTNDIGAVARTVLESLRTLFVWLADLLLFYIHLPEGLGKLGEPWNKSSYIQLAGFAVLVAGTVVYGRGEEEAEKTHTGEQKSSGGELPKLRPRIFKHTATISGWGHNSHNINRWRQAAMSAMLARDQEQA
jgi:drug/metabolite transporter (DMT)-like permease